MFYPESGHGLYHRLQDRIEALPELKNQLQNLGYFKLKAKVTEEMYQLIRAAIFGG